MLLIISKEKGMCGSVLSILMITCSLWKTSDSIPPLISEYSFPYLLKEINWRVCESLTRSYPLEWPLTEQWNSTATFQLVTGFELFPSEHAPDSVSLPFPPPNYLCSHRHKTGQGCWGSGGWRGMNIKADSYQGL